MLSVITGKQRAGKTFYCVTLIVKYLRQSDRNIYTNLPLNPDILCNYACNGKLKNTALYESYLKRLHVFVNFKNKKRREYRIFKPLNIDFIGVHKIYKTQLLAQDKIRTFWKITEPNSVIILDEVYQFFSATDIFDTTTKELRKELLCYSRQHGHFKDDMFLVSHSQHDLDIHIRRGIQRQYVVQNSKYTNMFEGIKWLRGLKYPWQFFLVNAYEYGETELSDRYVVRPDKIIFKCYNSFSTAETLNKKAVSASSKNTDSGVDNKENVMNYLRQITPYFLLVGCLVIGASITGYYFYSKFLSKTSTPYIYDKKQVNSAKKIEPEKVTIEKAIEYLKPRLITPDVIIYDGNLRLTKGMKIAGYEIKKILSDFVVLDNGARVSVSGIMPRPFDINNK